MGDDCHMGNSRPLISILSYRSITRLIQIISYILLIRLIEPSQLGEYVFILAVISLFEVLVGDYLIISVIGAKTLQQEVVGKCLSFGTAVSIVFVILILPLNSIFDNYLIFIMSLTLLFRPYNSLAEGLLTREFELSRLGFREMTAALAANLVVLLLFLLSVDEYLYLYARYVFGKAFLFISHAVDRKIRFVNPLPIHSFLSFLAPGFRKLSSNLLEAYTSKIDDLIIGQSISRSNLAVYEIGFQFPQTFRTLTIGSIFGYIVGVYRKLDLPSIGKFYVHVGMLSSIAATGFLWTMLIYGMPLIEFLFGHEYRDSYLITLAVSFSLSVRFMALSNLPLLVSRARSKGTIEISLLSAIFATILYLYGSRGGIQQIANFSVAVALLYYAHSSVVCSRYDLIQPFHWLKVLAVYSIFTIPAALFAVQSDLFSPGITLISYILVLAYISVHMRSRESKITFSKVRRLTNSSENRE